MANRTGALPRCGHWADAVALDFQTAKNLAELSVGLACSFSGGISKHDGEPAARMPHTSAERRSDSIHSRPVNWIPSPKLRRHHGPLLRHKSKVQKRVCLPTRNRDAATNIDPGLFGQESLKVGIIHPGDVEGVVWIGWFHLLFKRWC